MAIGVAILLLLEDAGEGMKRGVRVGRGGGEVTSVVSAGPLQGCPCMSRRDVLEEVCWILATTLRTELEACDTWT
jgi:hypothetical protein